MARSLDVSAWGESGRAGVNEGHLGELFREAGLGRVEETALSVTVEHATFEDWWEPYTFGVGPVGAFIASLDSASQARLPELCREALPAAPFTLTVQAWAARGLA